MSCANTTTAPSQVVPSTPVPDWLGWRPFVNVILALHDAFQEALAMRRAAHRNNPFINE